MLPMWFSRTMWQKFPKTPKRSMRTTSKIVKCRPWPAILPHASLHCPFLRSVAMWRQQVVLVLPRAGRCSQGLQKWLSCVCSHAQFWNLVNSSWLGFWHIVVSHVKMPLCTSKKVGNLGEVDNTGICHYRSLAAACCSLVVVFCLFVRCWQMHYFYG